jgi:hypothetical protein
MCRKSVTFDFSKNADVVPFLIKPYLISCCLANKYQIDDCSKSSKFLPRSSTLSIGVTNFSTVKNATRFAVYDETKINEKYHHDVAATRPDNDLGTRLIDCLMNEENEKKSALDIPKR